MKKITIWLLTAAVAVTSLAGCGKGKSEEKSVKEHVYRAEEIVLDEIEDKTSLNRMFVKDGRMYLVGYTWAEDGGTMYIAGRSPDGSDPSILTVQRGDNQSIDYVTADGAGNFYGVLNEYYEDASDPNNYIWENNYYLIKLDPQGKEVWRQPLKSDDSTSDYYGVSYMDILKDGRLLVLDDGGIGLYDTGGKLLKRVKPEQSLSGAVVLQLEDGTLAVDYYSETTGKRSLRRLEVETGKLSEEYALPGQSSGYSFYPGIGRDLLVVGGSGVYGYNLGDAELTELLNIIDSDLSSSYIYNLVAIDDRSFYGMMDDILSNEPVLMRFTKVDPQDVVDKQVLTLACNGLEWTIRDQVVKFNKGNEKYRISIRDYSEYNTEEDYEAGMTRLNTDIASGNIPDILILQSGMPVESFVAKGLFEDLYPYIDRDEEVKREDFFPNVLKAYETDGKLFRLVPGFTIKTVTGKTADVGEEPGWSLEDLNAVMDKKPEGTQVFTQVTRNDILNFCMQMSGDQYVKWETGECRFDTEDFVKLLEFMRQFPEQLDDSKFDESYWNDFDTQWRKGSTLLYLTYLDSFDTWNYMRKGAFGEEITMIGFPAAGGNGAVIMPNLDLAMSARSKNKEGAWEFLRHFITEKYQKEVSYGWPLYIKCMEELKEKAQKRQSYEDENGNLVEYDPEYTIGGITIPITPMSGEEAERIEQYILSVDQAYSYDANLVNIIEEEAAPYFSGQKSAKEAADIIQSRAQIYVHENR